VTISPSIRPGQRQQGSRQGRVAPGGMADWELTGYVMSPLARCASTATHPDEWFPVSTTASAARAEASRALALCGVCPVRAECLELSLRHWRSAGRHGVWGGLVEAERAAARREWLAGAEVTALLCSMRSREGRDPTAA
jgi:hypothetical protein